jgi:hypothetical protein
VIPADSPADNPGVSAETYFGDMLASLLTMAWFVEARDPYTGGHLWRVSRYARLLADATGHNAADAARIGLGGFLHDLGKIGVPDAILRKPERLTDEEYAVIKTHPDVGMRMLAGHPLAGLVSEAVLLHHERPDGNGYPRRLSVHQIPVPARIVGICDAFDAMTSHRPYRAGMPRDKALAIIGDLRGQQFHSPYADAFLALAKRGELDHVMGHSDDGIPLQSCPLCGPTLVIRREQQSGDHVYCRNCGGEFALEQGVATPTGRRAEVAELAPETDNALIARAVRATVVALPVAEMLKGGYPPLVSLE